MFTAALSSLISIHRWYSSSNLGETEILANDYSETKVYFEIAWVVKFVIMKLFYLLPLAKQPIIMRYA